MGENLVIVESPAKAKTIEKFLGKGYTVKSSFGHIRDLSKKNLGINIEKGFIPEYEISSDKKKVVTELTTLAKKASTVWLASDEDREGEAIAWHLFETLNLSSDNTRRIVFHEITKNAILHAIETPRDIDMNLVMAQQARRVLDRLVGFELSPILWKKIQPKLSAGRVQSVALRLIVDREREIAAFDSQPYFKVDGLFNPDGTTTKVKATLDQKFRSEKTAADFLEKCKNTAFVISSIIKKDAVRTPAAPFTTSALQQEAARKLGFSVNQTMTIAQKLYEEGLITYMRTDSTNLSSIAINTAKECITQMYGANYSKVRNYHTKVKGAQEAHEAIRPTYIQNTSINGSAAEKKLYDLIWKRTVASQMADARIEKTDVLIAGDNIDEQFVLQGEQIVFDGFLKVYIEGKDDEDEGGNTALLPQLSVGQIMNNLEITATEKFTLKPARYSEASLVKKLEELGIGRPSTYAPTISTIVKRGYIIKGDRQGTERKYTEFTLKKGIVTQKVKTEITGSEKGKLFPENIGIVVTDFLAANFPDILDYGFTAKVEEDFDKIANGKLVWNNVIEEFYAPFHVKVEGTMHDRAHSNAERIVGTDPKSGKVIISRIGRFGPLVQKGANDDPDKQFVSMKKGQLIENITLEEALQLFELPRHVGKYYEYDITAAIGRFGPYIKYNSSFVSLGKKYDPYTITEEEAIGLIEEHIKKEKEKFIAEFPEHHIQILNGRFGAYIKQDKSNYKIPRNTDPHTLTIDACLAIIEKETAAKAKKTK
ncbi:MAG: type I DNA topoisomerase [Bacteroidales bacterium]|nr:type I DNA topoisomerase [Bacteroidales bacterium]MDD4670096.1 type I DNA topoisomerase [Bacteroidales bacterium]